MVPTERGHGRFRVRLALLALTALVVLGVGLSDRGFAQTPVQVRIATEQKMPHPLPALAEKFKELAEAGTGGRVQVTVVAGGVLGDEAQLQEQVVLGTVEGAVTAAAMPELHPNFGLFDLPFLFASREHVYTVLDGDVGKGLRDVLLADTGVRVLGYGEMGFRYLTNNVRPIYTPADLQGVKIRVPSNRLWVEVFRALGADPTVVPADELYTALQLGMVDGQEDFLETIIASSLDEVQTFLTVSHHIYTPAYLLVNDAWWSELPPELQQQLQEAADMAVAWQRELGARADAVLVTQLEYSGLHVNQLDGAAFVEAARDVWNRFAPEVEADLVAAADRMRPSGGSAARRP